MPLPLSITVLTITTVLILLGFAQRVLDRMRMSSQTAMLLLFLMIIAHFLPDISLTPYTDLSLASLVPLGIVVYLLVTTSSLERRRGLSIGIITAVVLWASDKILPIEPESAWYDIDPLLFGGVVAGVAAYVLGRSRRSAFIGGILGILFTDIIAMIELYLAGIPQNVMIGGGGIFSGMIISPIIAVVIAEGIGEIRERLYRGSAIKPGGEDNE